MPRTRLKVIGGHMLASPAPPWNVPAFHRVRGVSAKKTLMDTLRVVGQTICDLYRMILLAVRIQILLPDRFAENMG